MKKSGLVVGIGHVGSPNDTPQSCKGLCDVTAALLSGSQGRWAGLDNDKSGGGAHFRGVRSGS